MCLKKEYLLFLIFKGIPITIKISQETSCLILRHSLSCCCFCRAMTVTRCCLYTTAPKAAWHLVESWMFPNRQPRRVLVPENVSRTWTVGPQRPRAPTKTWTPFTRTASGNRQNMFWEWTAGPAVLMQWSLQQGTYSLSSLSKTWI